MNNKFAIFLIIILFFNYISFGQYQRSLDLLPNNIYSKNEYLKYKLVYKFTEVWVTAGYVIFEFEERAIDGVNHIAMTAKGNTTPAFDIFYKVRDEYASVIKPDNFLPKYFFRRVSEGGYKIHNDFNFLHDQLKVIAEVQDFKQPHRLDTFSIQKNTQDLVSAILYCRSLDYKKLDSGQSFNFPMFLDRELHQIGIRYLGKERISTELGEYNCLVLQPHLISGRVFDETDKMRIYLTDDENRIPIHIESPLKVGKVMAILTKYKR